MKKIIMISFLSLLSYITKGQNKFSIALEGGPAFWQYKLDNTNGLFREVKNNANWSTGLKVQYDFSAVFAVSTGLNYSTKGYHVDYNYYSQITLDEIPIDEIFNYQGPFTVLESEVVANYLDLPLMISLNFLNRSNFSLYASAGMIFSMLTGKDEQSTRANGSESETNLIQGRLVDQLKTGELSAGIKCHLTRKWNLSLQPFFQWEFNSIHPDLKPNPVCFGAMVGFGYVFN